MDEDTERITDVAWWLTDTVLLGFAILFFGFIAFCGLMWVGSSIVGLFS